MRAQAGNPEKVTVFASNPEGVVVVKFKTAFAAGEAIKIMDGRFFAGRQISCT